MAFTLVAADPHPLSVLGLANVLKSEPDIELLACCSTAEEALEKVWQFKPDILLLDIAMKDRKGLDLINELKNSSLEIKVVIFTTAMDEEQTIDALRYGVKGVALKSLPVRLLVKCLHKVAAGGMWMEKESIGSAFERMLQREAGMRRLRTILTAREIEVMKQVSGGLSNQEIAEKLIVQEGTVKIHIHNIYRKLGIKNRVDLTLYAQKRGLV
jgi:DNA-binding NarL/FixJ family response regulator